MTAKRQFAFVRQLQKGSGANLKTIADIRSAERHANREDNTSTGRQRDGATHEDNYFWSLVGEGLENGGSAYVQAYKLHKKRHGVKSERKGAALAAHALVGVSPEWLQEAGDPHDLENPRVKQLIKAARDWIESWAGEKSVWAIRYDVDEVGSGVVDVLYSPVRMAHHKTVAPKPSISVNKANDDLIEMVNQRRERQWCDAGNQRSDYKKIYKSFRCMQDSWAWFAQEHLSPTLERGDPIEQTRRAHLFPEEYKESLEVAKSAEEFKEDARQMSEDIARKKRASLRDADEAEERKKAADQAAERALRERDEAAAITDELRQKERRLRAEIVELEEKQEELRGLEAAIAAARNKLREMRSQADEILQNAKAQAEELVRNAKAEATKIASDVFSAWPQFERVPDAFKQAWNHYVGLNEVVKEFFERMDLSNDAKYRAQVQPDEETSEGDPPPALDLILARSEKRIRKKNDLLLENNPKGPSL